MTLFGFPWYYYARDTLFNSVMNPYPGPADPLEQSIIENDFTQKLSLLDRNYDYAFISRPNMRPLASHLAENSLMIEVMDYLVEKRRTFIVLEEKGTNSLLNLKYLKSRHAQVTVPYQPLLDLLTANNQKVIESCRRDFQTCLAELVDRNKEVPPEHEENRNRLIEIYRSLGNHLLPKILITKDLLKNLKVRAVFGGMGTAYYAGMNNDYCMVEVSHGYQGAFHSYTPCHVPVRKYYRKTLKIDHNYCLQSSPQREILPQPDLYPDENIFNFGLPGTRQYDFSVEHIDALRDKFGLRGKKVLLINTSGLIDYNLFSRLVDQLLQHFPDLVILLRPHPRYEMPQSHAGYSARVHRVDHEDKQDLFFLADAVIGTRSSMIIEASPFTDNIIVISHNSKFRHSRELLQYKYSQAYAAPITAVEEIVDKLSEYFAKPSRKDFRKQPVDCRDTLSRMLASIDRTIGRNETMNKDFRSPEQQNVEITGNNQDINGEVINFFCGEDINELVSPYSSAVLGRVLSSLAVDHSVEPELNNVPGELSGQERVLLYHFFKYIWKAEKNVLELGPLLGSSTKCMALGMLANSAYKGKTHLYTYDKFDAYYNRERLIEKLAPLFENGVLEPRVKEGIAGGHAFPSFFEIFNAIHCSKPYSAVIKAERRVVPFTKEEDGFLRDQLALSPTLPYDVVFIDGCKSWYSTKAFMRETAKATEVGTYFIFQDYGWYTCFWLPCFVTLFLDHFQLVCNVDTTYIFRLVRPWDRVRLENFPDKPEVLREQDYDVIFNEVIKEAGNRGDIRQIVFGSLQHAAALAYIGNKDRARKIIDTLRDSPYSEKYMKWITNARISPTYTPHNEQIFL